MADTIRAYQPGALGTKAKELLGLVSSLGMTVRFGARSVPPLTISSTAPR